MANGTIGPKTAGFIGGGGIATALAPAATTVSMHYLGFVVDPADFEKAVSTLVNAYWFGVVSLAGVIGGLVIGYIVGKAQQRWGGDPQMPPRPDA